MDIFCVLPKSPDLKQVRRLESAVSLGRRGWDLPVKLLGGEGLAMLEPSDGDGHEHWGIQTAKSDRGVCLAGIMGSLECAETLGVCAVGVRVKTM